LKIAKRKRGSRARASARGFLVSGFSG
jgi:hypothetical protein